MRAALFIVLFFVATFFVPRAFADSLGHDWDGFYTGVMLGGQFGDSTNKTGSFGYNTDSKQWKYGESGLNGGAELGYNHSWNALVVGPEIELGYLEMRGSGAQPESPNSDTRGQSSSDFYTAFRARIGAKVDRYLIFADGGAIGVHDQTGVVDDCNIAPCGGSTVNAQKKGFVWGYTLGAGIERLLGKSWSIKLEYLYFNLNTQSFSGSTNLGNSYDWTGQTSGHIIRSGLNYHF